MDIDTYLEIADQIYNIEQDFDIIYDELIYILLQIYKKKDLNEYYIKQEIYRYFDLDNDEYEFSDFDGSEIYNELVNKPQVEQRSDEWFKQRNGMLTASELAVVFKKSPFCSQNQYIIDKVNPKPRIENSFCDHGIKYEDIATYIYEMRNGVKINAEFGCLPHSTISFLGASPDGITKEGTMIEIKCVVRRIITGIPPIYYWYQMQLQLEVANLNCCHFVECKIDEYSNYEEFCADSKEHNLFLTQNNMEKGIVFEYYNTALDKKIFIYNNDIRDIEKWKDDMITMVMEDVNLEYISFSYWYLSKYSCIKVYRNKKWFRDSLPLIEEFWNKVLYHKANGVEDLIKNKKTYNRKKVICQIE